MWKPMMYPSAAVSASYCFLILSSLVIVCVLSFSFLHSYYSILYAICQEVLQNLLKKFLAVPEVPGTGYTERVGSAPSIRGGHPFGDCAILGIFALLDLLGGGCLTRTWLSSYCTLRRAGYLHRQGFLYLTLIYYTILGKKSMTKW